MSDSLNKQLFEIPAIEFKDHLELYSNLSILFSGLFVKGKNIFL